MAKQAVKGQKTKSEKAKNGALKTPSKPMKAVSQKSHSSKKAEGKAGDASQAVCREPACEYITIGAGFCRLHYIKYWQRIKRKEAILKDGGLRQYIEELTSKYSEKHIEAIMSDLVSDDVFVKVISELDLHESEDELVDIDSTSVE